MKRVHLELQYFEGCPNHELIRGNLARAIQGIEDRVQIAEVLVEDEETAVKTMFRGSPTLLVNGEDVEGMSAPVRAIISCRLYRNGVPSADFVRMKIEEAYSKELDHGVS
jgi:hypothetical protein